MARMPPLEKLPLAARKNRKFTNLRASNMTVSSNKGGLVRDEWLSVQADVEQQLSDSMGTEWKIDIDPLAIVPYAEDGSWGRDSPGSLIST
jgi:hypothetical protein